MSKFIILTSGDKTMVDDWNFERLNQFIWGITKKENNKYVIRYKNKKRIYMHREILTAHSNQLIDHINQNGLDNREINLRFATKSTNAMNSRKRKDNTSGFRGVYKSKETRIKRYQAYINVNKKRIRLGWFMTAKEAAVAYNKAAKKYHKEFACLNIL